MLTMSNTPAVVRVMPGALSGTVDAIASKSAAHRLLICAALADAPTHVICSTTSQDIEATASCLRAMGADIEACADGFQVTPLDTAALAKAGRVTLDCGESGSTIRFLLPVAAALGATFELDGRGRLPQRPLEPLRSLMIDHGCGISEPGTWPVQVAGRMAGGAFQIAGNVSSQFITGLLMALPLTGEGGVIDIAGKVESRPYIDMTLAALASFGVGARVGDGTASDGSPCLRIEVPAGARFTSPGEVTVEGDWSNAAFWAVAGALNDDGITIRGLDRHSPQGDKIILDFLARFGAQVQWAGDGSAVHVCCGPEGLQGIVVDAADCPDLIPIVSIAAAFASGVTNIVNAGRLRIKESDRLETTSELLCRLRADVVELPEGLDIHGKGIPGYQTRLHGATVRAHGDHRLAMSAAVAALGCDAPVLIEDAQSVAKSYPGFFDDFAALGGTCELVDAEGEC